MVKKVPIFLFLLLLCQLIIVDLHAQTVDLGEKITIYAEDITLEEMLNKISEAGNINISFVADQIPLDQKVSLKAKNKSIEKIFNDLFINLNLDYVVIEKQVIIKPVDKEKEIPINKTPPKYSISGYVKDKSSGEVLIGATIVIKEMMVGTITNPYGFYSLTLPEGSYMLEYSFIGYERIVVSVELKNNQTLSTDLMIDESILDEVIIYSNEEELILEKSQMSEIKLKPKSVEHMPGFLGEVDFIKTLQNMPGIKIYGDGSTSFYIRGGNRDQNLILIDEAPIYNPAHLLGFFSVFSPDAIKDITIYKGDIPATYGGRLSGLIDIRTKDGNMKSIGVAGNIGPVTNSISIEGPLVKEISSVFLSVRQSQIGWLIPNESGNIRLNFYDINAKFNYMLSNKDRLFISYYTGKDVFALGQKGEDFGINWGNNTGTIRWNHVFSEKAFLNSTFYVSKYDYFLYSSIEDNDYWHSFIGNLAFKTTLTYYKSPKHIIKFGMESTSHYFNPGNFYHHNEFYQQFIPYVPEGKATGQAVFYSNDNTINEKFSIRYGLRLSLWQNIGKTTLYSFNEDYDVIDTIYTKRNERYHSQLHPEPRLSLSYRITPSTSFKASYNRNVQYIQLISDIISPFTALEVWLPAGPNIKAQIADQFALGYLKKIKNQGIDLSIEAFYKKMRHQIDYKEHANLLLNPLIEGELRFGDAWTYGTELMLKKNAGRLNGWISYTLSRSLKRISSINNNQSFPAYYDKPHDFSLYLNYAIAKRWIFSSQWIYTSGTAFTSPTGFYSYQGYNVPIYAEKNNDRLPDYHRLDLSVTWKLNKKVRSFNHWLTFTLYNAYGRENPIAINFNKILTDDNEYKIPSNHLSDFELVSTQLSLHKAIPSINYKFKF